MKELIKSITKGEWRFWAKVLIALIILTSISRIFGVLWTPPNYSWTGRSYFAPIDRYVYTSYIEQIKSGENILEDLYAAPDETAPMINVFWIGAGYFARITGASAMFTLEFLRVFFIPILLFILYLFLSVFFKDIFKRKMAFLLSVFGGGLGVWIYPLLEPFYRGLDIPTHLPIDFTISEAFVFTSSYYSSHFIASLALFLMIFLFALLALQNKKIIYGLYSGLCGLLLVNFHPFPFIVISFVFATYQIYLFIYERDRARIFFKYLLLFGIFSLPGALYHLKMMSTPWWQNQMWNSMTESSGILFVISGFGLMLIFAFFTIIKIISKKIKIKYAPFLIIWFFSQIALIFLPISVQRRFLEGYHLVLVILSVYFLAGVIERRRWILRGRFFAVTIFFIAFSFSMFLIIVLDFYNFYQRIDSMYIPKTYKIALERVQDFSKKDDVIIADIVSANMIPGIALRRVFVGHGVETLNAQQKLKMLTGFATGDSDDYRKNLLREYGIDYLFYDPNWNWSFDPDKKDFFEEIYKEGDYIFYRVAL